MSSNETIVVGGGLVGAAIAYGIAKSGGPVTLLDQGDVAHRASRGNFGLVWLQSKGAGFPRYSRWSRDAVDHWSPLADELRKLTGVDVDLQQNGGFWIGFSEKEVAEREAMLAKINADGRTPFEMLDHQALKIRLPAIGPKVAGGSWCPHAPVVPKRGQVLITERLKKFLLHPTNKARQTAEGTVQLGFSAEDVGLDDGTTVEAIESIAKRAVVTFPILSSVKLVRAWGSLRVLTPDGSPIYQESSKYPGAFTATSHSGVSLAGSHAYEIAPWIAGVKPAPDGIGEFAGERFLDPNRKFNSAY
jgi:glycine/D-amino acid oxidase-like deaminating enzyme